MTTPKTSEPVPETDLELVRRLLARGDIRSNEFVNAATRWEQELASGKYTHLTEKQKAWAKRVDDACLADDIGIPTCGFGGLYGDDEDGMTESDFDPNIGDR